MSGPRPHPPLAVPADRRTRRPPVTDGLLGPFWPDRGVPGPGLACSSARSGSACWPRSCCPYRDAGIGTFLVLLAGGVVILAASKRGDDAFTQACAGICVLLAAVTVVRDADWIIFLSIVTGAIVTVCGVTGARTMPGLRALRALRPARRLRGLPWLGRSARRHDRSRQHRRRCSAPRSGRSPGCWSSVCSSPPPTRSSRSGPTRSSPTSALESFVLRVVHRRRGGRRRAGGGVPRPQPAARRPAAGGGASGQPAVRVAGPGAGRRRGVRRVPGAQATVIFGGHDYLRAHHRADLRRLRARGLRPADRGHRADAPGDLGGRPQGTARDPERPALAAAAARPPLRRRRWWWWRSALYRMHVYQEAYGFTELRLLVDVFEGWLGLLVLAVLAAGLSLKAAWLPRFALLSGAGLIVGAGRDQPGRVDRPAQRRPLRGDRQARLVLPGRPLRRRRSGADDAAGRRTCLCAGRPGACRRRLARVEPRTLAGRRRPPRERLRHDLPAGTLPRAGAARGR